MAFKIEKAFDGYSTLGADYASDAIEAGSFSQVAVQVKVEVAADAYGTVRIQGAIDPDLGWSNIAFVDQNGAIQDGYALPDNKVQDIVHIFDLSDVGVGWIRVKYDRTSGQGGLTWKVHKKH